MYSRYPWPLKLEKAFWRGSSSGIADFSNNSRMQVVSLSQKHPELLDVAFNNICQMEERQKKELKKKISLQNSLSQEKQLQYKYLLALDGNCFPGAFFWQLRSQSLIFKEQSEYLEWYYAGLYPNFHYINFIPQELTSKILEWKKKDKEAKEITHNAYCFAQENLSTEDMMSYTFHLLTAYTDLQS